MKYGPIVLIDDDADEPEILRNALRDLKLDVEVVWFSNGLTAFKYLQTTDSKPLLILSDINMPGIGGIELRRRIIADQSAREKSVPFVFFTTAAGNLAIKEAYKMCVQGFFQKPPVFAEYKKMIQQLWDYWQVCRHPND